MIRAYIIATYPSGNTVERAIEHDTLTSIAQALASLAAAMHSADEEADEDTAPAHVAVSLTDPERMKKHGFFI